MTLELLLKLNGLLRSFALQVITRVLAHACAYAMTFLLKYKLLDDSLAATVLAVLPGLAASILIETGFSFLQKKWNLLKIDVARRAPERVTRAEVTTEAIRELKVATGEAQPPSQIEARLREDAKR